MLAAQAELDSWVTSYNCDRPHQALDMGYPIDRFAPSQTDRAIAEQLLPLHLPAILVESVPSEHAPEHSPEPTSAPAATQHAETLQVETGYRGGPVEFERVVPASGNLAVAGKQFWLGTARAGVTVTFWADHDVIHLLIGGARVKTVRSHLSSSDLAALAATGGRPAGPSPLPPPEPDATAVEVDRTVSRTGLVVAGPAPGPGRGNPRRPPHHHPHRPDHVDVLRPRHPRTAAHPRKPAHHRADPPTARRPPRRPPPRPPGIPLVAWRHRF